MAQTLKGRKVALVTVDWDETSGVDHPANETEGWLVIKAANGGSTDGTTEDANDSDVFAELLSEYLDNAPEAVTKAAQTVIDYIASVEDDNDAPDAVDGSDEDSSPTQKSSRVRKLIGKMFKSEETPTVTDEEVAEFVQSTIGMSPQEKYEAVEAFKQKVTGA
jgi:hypothetical protein